MLHRNFAWRFWGFGYAQTWATGFLASTRRITVFATAHRAFTHPIVAAKQFATMDQIGSGRFGLNVVCGWNKPEYDMFGIPLPTEHTARYGFGQEWYDVVRIDPEQGRNDVADIRGHAKVLLPRGIAPIAGERLAREGDPDLISMFGDNL